MTSSYIAVIVLLVFPFYLAFFKKQRALESDNLKVHYIKSICIYPLFIAAISIIDTSVVKQVDFSKVGKGFILPIYLYIVLLLFHIMPFFMELVPQKKKGVDDSEAAGDIYGVPVKLFPNSHKELIWFVLFMVTGVITEEIVFRQFMFHVFNNVFHFTGDTILFITSTLFTISHLGQREYRKVTRVILVFVSGLFYGKCFQMSGSIYYPIIIHLLNNGAIAVIAFKRLHSSNRQRHVY